VDLVLVEYSLNDNFQTSAEAYEVSRITEELIRHIYQAHPQVMLLYLAINVVTPFEKNPERGYQQVCDLYGVPLLSYRRAIVEEFDACKARQGHPATEPYLHAEEYCLPHNKTNTYTFTLWDGTYHPPEETHRSVAQTVTYYLTRLITLYNSSSLSIPEPVVLFPDKPIYARRNQHGETTDSQSGEGGCAQPMMQASSLHGDEDTNVTSLRESFRPKLADGWSFRRDRRGKPYGWIADSNPKNKSQAVTDNNLLSFLVLTVNGSISITYLSTYENSGIFEVYMGFPDFAANGGILDKFESPKNSLCKCKVLACGILFIAY
jgi:hypothetical protein